MGPASEIVGGPVASPPAHGGFRLRGATRRIGLAGLAGLTPAPVTDALWGRDRLTVLAYHRILDPAESGGLEFDPGVVSATPEMFERQMRHVARNFSVIGLSDLDDHLATGRALPDRPALITFDDGYRDNYDAAFPVLRAMGLPAVIFLITGAIGTDRVMWWDELPYLLANTALSRAELPLVGVRELAAGPDRAALRADLLRALKEVPDERRATAMEELRVALGVAAPRLSSPLFIGWDEVEDLVAHGVECQPHTVDHPLLTRVNDRRARDEVARSAADIAERTGRTARAFAYPNGSYDASTLDALRAAGISIGFTMRLGPCRAAAVGSSPLEIPRVALEGRDTWDLFRLKVSGVVSTVFRAARWRPGRSRRS